MQKKLIVEENCSISEACYKSGFESESHFFHSLKRCFSVRPESIGKVGAVLIRRAVYYTDTDI